MSISKIVVYVEQIKVPCKVRNKRSIRVISLLSKILRFLTFV